MSLKRKHHQHAKSSTALNQVAINTDSQNNFSHMLMSHEWVATPKMDVRDAKILVKVPKLANNVNELSNNVNELSNNSTNALIRWTTHTIERVNSDAFENYHQQILNEGQMKAYAAKNMLLNYYAMMQQMRDSNTNIAIYNQVYKKMESHSSDALKRLIAKYPQSQSNCTARKLKQVIKKTDNRENDQFDLLRFSNHFEYKESGVYLSEIMQTLKWIMKITSNPLFQKDDSLTNFEGFNLLFESIFTQSTDQHYKAAFHQKLKSFAGKQNSKSFKQLFDSQANNNDGCQYVINQKISPNVKTFTQQDIQIGNFKLNDVSILRVMNKWSEQLRQKLSNCKELIRDRGQHFKDKKGNLIELTLQQRDCLYKIAEEEEKRINQVTKHLKQQCKLMMVNLCIQKHSFLYTNDIDGNLGLLALRTQQCVAKYMLSYLNQLIHSLIKIPIQAQKIHTKQKVEDKNKGKQLLTINLITFKIGDLLRSKCIASESHIINTYNFFTQISEKHPQILRIVRVKNRLDLKDNDILINLFFMNKIQCEVQLSVLQPSVNKKKTHYSKFNHFIYQLIRAQFGPIVQCACILAHYDPIIKKQTHNFINLSKIVIQNTNQKNNQNTIAIFNSKSKYSNEKHCKNLPFFCNSCLEFSLNNNYQFYQLKNQRNMCNNCYQQNLIRDQSRLTQQLFRYKGKLQIQKIKQHFQCILKQSVTLQQPKLNLIKLKQIKNGFIINKNTQKPNPLFFQIIEFAQQLHFVCNIDKKQTANKVICTLKQQTQIQELLQKFFIYKLKKNQKIQKIKNQQKREQTNVISCQCCQLTKMILGNTFSTQNDIVVHQNTKMILDYIRKQKQILDLSKRKISQQLNLINLSNRIKNLYIHYNQIQNLNFIEKLQNLKVIKLSTSIFIQVIIIQKL